MLMNKKQNKTGFNKWLVLFFFVVVLPLNVMAKETIYSSVSQEFPQGLHAKYLHYIANKLDMTLDVAPMPFARRLQALRNGSIDIMVGMQRENSYQDEIIYIYPAYEKLRHTFFVLKDNQAKLASLNDLRDLNIGVTIHAKYYKKFQQQQDLRVVPVSSLKQKIELLLKGRIDTFIHYQESTEPLLIKQQLSDKIVLAAYQPTEFNQYFVTISQKSRLLPYQNKLSAIIKHATENGDFELIRRQHYGL